MKCRVCDREMRKLTRGEHFLEKAPARYASRWEGAGICLGCWYTSIELEKFLVRAAPDRAVMGPWAEGYLKAIIEDPRRFLK